MYSASSLHALFMHQVSMHMSVMVTSPCNVREQLNVCQGVCLLFFAVLTCCSVSVFQPTSSLHHEARGRVTCWTLEMEPSHTAMQHALDKQTGHIARCSLPYPYHFYIRDEVIPHITADHLTSFYFARADINWPPSWLFSSLLFSSYSDPQFPQALEPRSPVHILTPYFCLVFSPTRHTVAAQMWKLEAISMYIAL